MKLRLLMVVLVAMSAACGNDDPTPVPDSVIGLWVSDDERYADTPFEITHDLVIIGQGGRAFDSHGIREVEIDDDIVTLRYRDRSGDWYDFRLRVMSEGDLRFPNQPLLRWYRDPDREVIWEILRNDPQGN